MPNTSSTKTRRRASASSANASSSASTTPAAEHDSAAVAGQGDPASGTPAAPASANEAPLPLDEEIARLDTLLEERRQHVGSLAAQLSAAYAEIASIEARIAQAEGDLAALPARIAQAEAQVLIQPESASARARLEALQALRINSPATLAGLAAERERAATRRDAIEAEKADVERLILVLTRRRFEAHRALGQQRRDALVAAIRAKLGDVAAAREQAQTAETELEALRARAETELAGWGHLLEDAELQPVGYAGATGELLDRFHDFLTVLVKYGATRDALAFQIGDQYLAPVLTFPLTAASVLFTYQNVEIYRQRLEVVRTLREQWTHAVKTTYGPR